MTDKKIVIFTYYDFPCTEPVLVNVFAKELGRNNNIQWLFQGDVSKGKAQKWYNSEVILCKKKDGCNAYDRFFNKIYSWVKFINLVSLILKKDVSVVLMRDLPLETLLIFLLKKSIILSCFFNIQLRLGILISSILSQQNHLSDFTITRKGFFIIY